MVPVSPRHTTCFDPSQSVLTPFIPAVDGIDSASSLNCLLHWNLRGCEPGPFFRPSFGINSVPFTVHAGLVLKLLLLPRRVAAIVNRFALPLLLALPVAAIACGGENLTLPSDGEPASIAVLSGNEQSGRVGTTLTNPLVVQVTDNRARPVAGASVVFEFTDQASGTATPATVTSDADGKATAELQLGTRVGSLSGRAHVEVDAGTVPVEASFTAIALSDDAFGIAQFSGEDQTGPVNAPLTDSLVVQVTDKFNNPIPDITIGWSVGDEGGTVSAASTVTGADGKAAVKRTLGPNSGPQTTEATAEGLAGSPVIFHHTATAGAAARVEKVSGDGQEAPAGSQLPLPLVVRVLDASNNPIQGRAVTWLPGEGGGSVTPTNGTTDAQGRATAQWTLGSTPGANTLNAVVSEVSGGPAVFTATGTGTGAASALAITTQPSDVTIGEVISPAPVVQIRDARGNDVATGGVEVTVGRSSGPGTLEGTLTVTTDASGKAQFPDLKITGKSGTHRLIFAADGFKSATSSKFEVTKRATSTTITGVNPEPSEIAQAVTVSFTVGFGAGSPTGNVRVSASTGESCTGSSTAATGQCQITFITPGVRTLTAEYQTTDQFAASTSTGVQHTVNAALPPPNNVPVAAFEPPVCTVGVPCQFSDGSSDSDGTVEGWAWDFGGGVTSDSKDPVHTFDAAGDVPVSLTVTDDDGAASTTVTHSVTVQ